MKIETEITRGVITSGVLFFILIGVLRFLETYPERQKLKQEKMEREILYKAPKNVEENIWPDNW